jgi:hypothetical protein
MLNLDLARAHHDELRRVAADHRRHSAPARRRITARRGVFRRTR